MEGLATESVCAPVSVTENMGRRGLHFRRPREINVPKVLGEHAGTDPPPAATYGTSVAAPSGGSSGGSSAGSGTASKFQPKLYIPERLKAAEAQKEAQQKGYQPSGSLISGEQYSGVVTEQPLYSSRVLHGRDPTPERSSSVLATSRGLFQLRPRRNIRVKSFDELERDDGGGGGGGRAEERRDTEGEASSYATGFLKEQAAARERLARRGRHSISDMLGTSAISAPPGAQADVFGADEAQSYLAPEVHGQLMPSYCVVDGDAPDGCFQQPMEHPAPEEVTAGITHLTENLNNLELADGEQSRESDTRHLSENSGNVEIEKAASRDSGNKPHHMDTDKTVLNGFQTDSLSSSLLSSADRGREETIDERKERILANLREQKMAALSVMAPVDPNFETLEQKKARIFARLSEKHGINIQPQMLGLPLLPEGGATVLPSLLPSILQHASQQHQATPYSSMYPDSLSTAGQKSIMSGRAVDEVSNGESSNSHAYSFRDESRSTESSLLPKTPDVSGRTELSGSHFRGQGSTVEEVTSYEGGYTRENVQRMSPTEDMCSVDSGFHGGDTGREDSPSASVTPPMIQKTQVTQAEVMKKSGSPRADVKKAECSSGDGRQMFPVRVVRVEKGTAESSKKAGEQRHDDRSSDQSNDESHDETLVKPSAVKATGSLQLKKSAPPTKPKPKPIKMSENAAKPTTNRPPTGQGKTHQSRSQAVVKQQPPRPKSAPPNKSKSFVSLPDAVSPARTGRRASTSSREDVREPSPFSRNSRLRSSTKAWELRQAEKQAEIRSRQQSSGRTTPRPQTAKKPVITGQVSVSPSWSSTEGAAEKQKTGPRSSSYEKPWRTGSVLASKGAGSFTIRSAQPEKCSVPERPRKPLSTPNSASTSRTQSPSSKSRNTIRTPLPTTTSKQKHPAGK